MEGQTLERESRLVHDAWQCLLALLPRHFDTTRQELKLAAKRVTYPAPTVESGDKFLALADVGTVVEGAFFVDALRAALHEVGLNDHARLRCRTSVHAKGTRAGFWFTCCLELAPVDSVFA